MTSLLVSAYLAAIVAANLLTTHDPRWAPVNAFFLIGLDLIARDRLDDAWRKNRILKMGALVLAGSIISFAVNADASRVALASAVAFGAAFTTDWAVYSRLRNRPWLERANWSNIPSSAVDSIIFPLIAFPIMDWYIVVTIFAAKVGGGALWSLLLKPKGSEWGANQRESWKQMWAERAR
jgi:hypothetical protein